MEGGSDVRRKKNRKRREWNGYPSKEGGGGAVDVEEEDASTWEYGDGGKKLRACERKERQDTEAIFIDLLYLCCFAFPLLCNTKPTQGSSNYKIHMCLLHIVVLKWQDGICIVQT